MFDDLKFTGTINLGNVVNTVVFLLGSIALYFRVKAEIVSHEQKTGKKIETSLAKRFGKRKKVSNSSGQATDSQEPTEKENGSTQEGEKKV